MAFKFVRSNTNNTKSSPVQSIRGQSIEASSVNDNRGRGIYNNNKTPIGSMVGPKLTNSQLNQLTKVYPSWLRDNSGSPQALKQLPGIYQGVLGQVQVQPNFGTKTDFKHEIRNNQQLDYMNRLTDTQRVSQLLSASQLPNETLATIWAHVNKTYPGKLTNREVCLALALIAIFQRIESENLGVKVDPFSLVKSEKSPPIPKLYPSNTSPKSSSSSQKAKQAKKTFAGLLVDFNEEENSNIEAQSSNSINATKTASPTNRYTKTNITSPISLIDTDGHKFEANLARLTEIWLKVLNAIKTVFKRSFDILNVENSRQSAIEALKSSKGKEFSKNLCLCYPIAHNIKFKIDQLNEIQLSLIPETQSNGIWQQKQQDKTKEAKIGNNDQDTLSLFDKNYVKQIDDLMTSINEYLAVLINLFHESGQTQFIELIMDGLNKVSDDDGNAKIKRLSLEELNNELFDEPSESVCSICRSRLYLVKTNTKDTCPSFEDLKLIRDTDDDNEHCLISNDDKRFYYHAKCANFWLHQVDPSNLPFQNQADELRAILSPS